MASLTGAFLGASRVTGNDLVMGFHVGAHIGAAGRGGGSAAKAVI